MPRIMTARRAYGHQRMFVRFLPTRTVNGYDLGDSPATAYEIQVRHFHRPDADPNPWVRIGWACGHPRNGRRWRGCGPDGKWTHWRSTRTEIAEDIADE